MVAQIWRGGRGPQVEVARLLAGVEVAAIDDALGRRAGVLLARSGQSDPIDASVVCLAADGDDIVTSDPGDLRAQIAVVDDVLEKRLGSLPVIADFSRRLDSRPAQDLVRMCPARFGRTPNDRSRAALAYFDLGVRVTGLARRRSADPGGLFCCGAGGGAG